MRVFPSDDNQEFGYLKDLIEKGNKEIELNHDINLNPKTIKKLIVMI